MRDLLFDEVFLDNTPYEYLTALLLAVGIYVFAKLIGSAVFSGLIKRSRSAGWKWDAGFFETLKPVLLPAVYFAGIYYSINRLTLPEPAASALSVAIIIILVWFAVRIISLIINTQIYFYSTGKNDTTSPHDFQGLKTILSIILWAIAVVFILDNLGFKISAVIAGLGIGGIALALASQAILGDLFGYFSIIMDHPFKVGDFIRVDQQVGTVEQIGIKTTRIRSLSGEMLVFPNRDLTDSRIHNFGRMQERRVVFTISVTYDTPLKKIKEIPGKIRRFVEEEEDVRFDRAHFREYGENGLIFEIVYYVLSPDFIVYMTKQQNINLKIYSYFEKSRISFAYPTRTVYVKKR